jgi:hypothetical protein
MEILNYTFYLDWVKQSTAYEKIKNPSYGSCLISYSFHACVLFNL